MTDLSHIHPKGEGVVLIYCPLNFMWANNKIYLSIFVVGIYWPYPYRSITEGHILSVYLFYIKNEVNNLAKFNLQLNNVIIVIDIFFLYFYSWLSYYTLMDVNIESRSAPPSRASSLAVPFHGARPFMVLSSASSRVRYTGASGRWRKRQRSSRSWEEERIDGGGRGDPWRRVISPIGACKERTTSPMFFSMLAGTAFPDQWILWLCSCLSSLAMIYLCYFCASLFAGFVKYGYISNCSDWLPF